MPFDFNEFLTLAEELATHADEASKRSSISRAYYTAYHLASSRAERNIGPWRGRNEPTRLSRHKDLTSHAWCWRQYKDTNDINCRKVGVDGERMKKRRHTVDYERADIPHIDIEVQRQLDDAQQLRAEIAALDPAFPRPM